MPVQSYLPTMPPYTYSSEEHPLVFVMYMPSNPTPNALMALLWNCGFEPKLVSLLELQKMNLTELPTVRGVIITGTSNMQDSRVGVHMVSTLIKHNFATRSIMRSLLQSPNVFSMFFGADAATAAFEMGLIKLGTSRRNNIVCAPNASRQYESRWVTVQIPFRTKCRAFARMKAANLTDTKFILPCWVQGTHLGFTHGSPDAFNQLQDQGMVAALYHQPRPDDGLAERYPENPTETMPVAAICSSSGRHLATTFDPALSSFAWQWPSYSHPPRAPTMMTSPWKLMFATMYEWAVIG